MSPSSGGAASFNWRRVATALRPNFHRTHAYDLLRMALFVGTCVGLQALNMSRVYHFIRGQAMIKLYVIISMVEIFDRLLSSFGQDVLDSLYWTVRTDPYSLRFQPLLAFVYIWIHSCLFFINVATINVAINSADHALLTLLISNNFAEIKTSVFKKFDANNLFQVASSDVTERFKLCIFVSQSALIGSHHDRSLHSRPIDICIAYIYSFFLSFFR